MVQQDALVAINDSTFSVVLRVSPADAVSLVQRYPARFSFISADDPRTVVATIAPFQTLGADVPIPVITGSQSGGAALSSLIAGLKALGLLIDATSA
jgi:hypothetical protein